MMKLILLFLCGGYNILWALYYYLRLVRKERDNYKLSLMNLAPHSA